MGVILAVVTYFAGYFAILFEAISIACGLYYAAELAEEYSSIAKRIITWTTVGVIVIHFSLLLEGFPPIYICTGVACHLAYALLLTNFPFIEVVSVKSLIVLAALVLDHYVWFMFFRAYSLDVLKTMALFFLLVWLVPFSLFISLTVAEQSIPLSTPSSASSLASPGGSSFFDALASPSRKQSKAAGKGTRGYRAVMDSLNSVILPGAAKRV